MVSLDSARCGGGSVDSVHFGVLMVLTLRISNHGNKFHPHGKCTKKNTPGLEFCCLFPLIYSLVCQKIVSLESLETWRMLDRSSSWRSVIWWSPRPWRKWPPSSWRTSRASPNPVTWMNWHRCHQRYQRFFEVLTVSQNHGGVVNYLFSLNVFSLLTLKGLQLLLIAKYI